MQASDVAVADADDAQVRRVQFLGEVWAAWGRGRQALRQLLNADIKALRGGPELLGMVLRRARRHYIFLNDRLPRQAPLVEMIVLAHESVHIVEGVEVGECCHPSLALALRPAEWETWVKTGFWLIPERYGQLWVQGWTPADILARHADTTVTERMVTWRGLMEIAQGKAPGNQVQALADANAMLRDSLASLAAAAELIHDQTPSHPERIVTLAQQLLRGNAAALLAVPAAGLLTA
ncbi:MAG: hypothetical protein AB7P40_20230 [Chloroflexota bacterium]